MKIHWKTLPVKPATESRHEVHVMEAWVKDFRIGWITATFFYIDGDRHFNDLSAVSAVIKTRKLFANYLGNPVAYHRIERAVMAGDYTEVSKWVEEQWTNMLQKAGII